MKKGLLTIFGLIIILFLLSQVDLIVYTLLMLVYSFLPVVVVVFALYFFIKFLTAISGNTLVNKEEPSKDNQENQI